MKSANIPTRTINRRASSQTLRMALMISGGVLCLGLLSYFAHLVQAQVKRGESFREAQRAGLYAVRDGSVLRPARMPSVENSALRASATPR